jgi:hypothetical protein
MTRHKGVTFLVSLMIGAAVVPAAAFGLRSYDGNDYSEDYNYAKQVRICDMESDSNGAYAKYRPNGTTSDSRVDDSNGSQSGCTGTASFTHIYSHQACEDINLQPDHCGTRVYP